MVCADQTGGLEACPPEYTELLMGFEMGYTKISSPMERQKQCGNAVVPAVVDYNLREQVANLPKNRRWVILSLFNGIDGFPLGIMEAAESLWLIDELMKKQHDENDAAATGTFVTSIMSSDDDSSESECSGSSNRHGRVVRLQKRSTRLERTDLLGKCCADLRRLAEEHGILPFPQSYQPQAPPWLPHGMLLVSVECDENARRVTRVQHKIRRQRYGDDDTSNRWTLVDKVPEFCTPVDVKDRKGNVRIKRGEPDVATVSKLTVEELEAAVARAIDKGAAADDARDSTPLEIDIICGGSPCVNLVGNALHSKTIRSLHTLRDDDPSKLWSAQKLICHQLMRVYKLRDGGEQAARASAPGERAVADSATPVTS